MKICQGYISKRKRNTENRMGCLMGVKGKNWQPAVLHILLL